MSKDRLSFNVRCRCPGLISNCRRTGAYSKPRAISTNAGPEGEPDLATPVDVGVRHAPNLAVSAEILEPSDVDISLVPVGRQVRTLGRSEMHSRADGISRVLIFHANVNPLRAAMADHFDANAVALRLRFVEEITPTETLS